MKKDFEIILDESLSRLKQKESIEACLDGYPRYAAQLEPLLRTALKLEVLKDAEPPSAEAMAVGRERFLREAARLRAEKAPARKLAKGPTRSRRLILSMVGAILIAALLALAALAGFEAPDTLRRLYHWWGTLVPQPTMTQPATDTPWPTMTLHEDQTPTATPTLYPADRDTPTFTFTPQASHTPVEKAPPVSKPANTPLPTATSGPPTHTPGPTITPVPPTDTPVPTATPMPPTHTPHHPTEDHGGGQGDGDHGDGDPGGGNNDSGDHGEGHDDDDHGGGQGSGYGGGQGSGDGGGQGSGDGDGGYTGQD